MIVEISVDISLLVLSNDIKIQNDFQKIHTLFVLKERWMGSNIGWVEKLEFWGDLR